MGTSKRQGRFVVSGEACEYLRALSAVKNSGAPAEVIKAVEAIEKLAKIASDQSDNARADEPVSVKVLRTELLVQRLENQKEQLQREADIQKMELWFGRFEMLRQARVLFPGNQFPEDVQRCLADQVSAVMRGW